MFSCSRFISVLVLAAPILLVPLPVFAQSPTCDSPQGSGACLPWGYTDLSAELPGEILDLSKDGSVVVGEVGQVGVYQWKLGTGARQLDFPGSEVFTIGRTVMSANGEIVVGISTMPPLVPQVFRWDVEQDITTILPSGPTVAIQNVFPMETNGTVLPTGLATVSADGNTIVGVGEARNSMGALVDQSWIFRWTMAGGTTDIPQLAFPFPPATATARRFTPYAIAGDGVTIVGQEVSATLFIEAASWVPDPGPNMGIATNLMIPDFPTRATAVTFNGQIIGGFRPDIGLGASSGFVWSAFGGEFNFPVVNIPRTISDDGEIITSLNLQAPPPLLPLPEPWVDVFSTDESEWMFDYLSFHYGIFGFPNASFNLSPLGLVSGNGRVFSHVGAEWVVNVPPINFVSLGDSYSSGEGTPIFRTDTDVDGTNECHRSFDAYPGFIRPRFSFYDLEFAADPVDGEPGFSWDFLACSGVETRNVRRTLDSGASGEGQFPGSIVNGIDHGLPQLTQGPADGNTDLVTISIGGNDAQFVSIAKFCFRKFNCQNDEYENSGQTLQVWFNEHVRQNVKPDLIATYNQIKAEAPNAAIIVVGYPLLTATDTCGDLPSFQEGELAFIRSAGILLNQVIREATIEAGVHFVAVADLFDTHEVCGTSPPWLNPIEIFTTNREYSLHPTAEGQRAYASAISGFLGRTGISYPHGFFESGFPKNPPPVP